MTEAEMMADIAFLLLRSGCAGSAYFGADRWTGMSSNAIVSLAYGGEQTVMPSDRSDYAACARTVHRLPRHRRTPAIMTALAKAREAYLQRYPAERFPAGRKALREEWERKRHRRHA